MNQANMSVWNDAEDYRDVSVYIRTGGDADPEYKTTVTLNKETGETYQGPWEVAPDAVCEPYKEIPLSDVPSDVLDEFDNISGAAYSLALGGTP